MTTRNEIFDAVLALANGVTWQGAAGAQTFAEARRRIVDWDNAQKPGLYQVELKEQIEQKLGLPYKRIFSVEWWVYVNDGIDPNVDPSVTANNIVDALQAATAPTPSDLGYPTRNTLGGIVHHLWINGSVLKIAGDLEGAGLITIPLSILVP